MTIEIILVILKKYFYLVEEKVMRMGEQTRIIKLYHTYLGSARQNPSPIFQELHRMIVG